MDTAHPWLPWIVVPPMRVGQARKRDSNEPEIVRALKQIGVTVHKLSAPGLPDLLTWHPREGVRLIEVKAPKGTLTEAQIDTFEGMPVCVVRSVADALILFGVTS